METSPFLQMLNSYKAGRKKLDDELFTDLPPSKLGIFDLDNEELCHNLIQTVCPIPGCDVISSNLLDSENHYNSKHRYTCSKCRKSLPSPHLLDLHVQEQHDSFFAVMAVKKPSFACYIEECPEKFMTPEERLSHGIKKHKLPKNFRFDNTTKSKKKTQKMDVDFDYEKNNKYLLHNSRKDAFKMFFTPTFKNNRKPSTSSVNIDEAMADIKESLPNT